MNRKATIAGRPRLGSSDLGSFCHFQGVFDFDAYHYLGEKDKTIAAAAKEYRVFNDPEAAMALEFTYAESGYVAAWLRNAQGFEEVYIKLLRDIKLDYWADKYSQPSE